MRRQMTQIGRNLYKHDIQVTGNKTDGNCKGTTDCPQNVFTTGQRPRIGFLAGGSHESMKLVELATSGRHTSGVRGRPRCSHQL
jgi:hypothetical protein